MRFQVRKRRGMWEVVAIWPGQRSWQVLESYHRWAHAMVLATGQPPYELINWRRSMSITWSPA